MLEKARRSAHLDPSLECAPSWWVRESGHCPLKHLSQVLPWAAGVTLRNTFLSRSPRAWCPVILNYYGSRGFFLFFYFLIISLSTFSKYNTI